MTNKHITKIKKHQVQERNKARDKWAKVQNRKPEDFTIYNTAFNAGFSSARKYTLKEMATHGVPKCDCVCGEEFVIWYNPDDGVQKLNFELAVTKMGTVGIMVSDCSTKDVNDLFFIHIKEAIEIKAIIDKLIVDATLHEREYVQELSEKFFSDTMGEKKDGN